MDSRKREKWNAGESLILRASKIPATSKTVAEKSKILKNNSSLYWGKSTFWDNTRNSSVYPQTTNPNVASKRETLRFLLIIET